MQALLEVVGYSNKDIQSEQIGYIIAPRLNAAGRVEDPRAALNFGLVIIIITLFSKPSFLMNLIKSGKKKKPKCFSSLFEDKKNQESMEDDIVVVSGKIGAQVF